MKSTIVTNSVLLILQAVLVEGWSAADELSIRSTKLAAASYDRLVRPEDAITVKVGISLISINDLSMVDQSMSITGWLTVEWEDSRITWTPASFTNVDHIYALDKEIWKPELFIDNSVEDVSILQDDNLLFRVSYTGRVDWEMPQIFVTSCTIDTTYYPFDTQECAIDVTSWSHSKEELELLHLRDYVDTNDIAENGEWLYVGSRVETLVIKETIANRTTKFSLLKFVVILNRRYAYYVANIILPVLITSFLIILVFVLPVDSGEKVSYALTVILALAVLLTLIADSMPNTSNNVSILSVYLAYTLIMGVMAVGLTVLIIRIHSQDPDKPVPVWLHKVTRRLFARGACWKDFCCCRYNTDAVVTMGHASRVNKGQRRACLMYSWTEIAKIFDWFLFVAFLWSTTITTLMLMVTLKVGSAFNKHG